MTSLIRVEQITCIRGDKLLFQNFSMGIQSGEMVQIVGQNGSGKTTLLRIIAGLLTPQEGTVFWKNASIQFDLSNYFEHLFYLGHHRGIKGELTVFENLTVDCRYPIFNKETVMIAIRNMKLLEKKDVLCRNLSEGQRQRVALAKLFIANRLLWVLDEPLNGLDSEGVSIFENLLETKIKEKGSVIISTHRPLNLSNLKIKTVELS